MAIDRPRGRTDPRAVGQFEFIPVAFGVDGGFGLRPAREIGRAPRVAARRPYAAGRNSGRHFKLTHYPALRELADGPFWTDTADPHRVVLRRQMTDNPRIRPWERLSLELEQVYAERVWSKAIDRIILEGWTAERAADEAIARTKQIVGG